MNIQCSGGSRYFKKQMGALKMRNTMAQPLEVHSDQLRAITKADPLRTTQAAKELNINHATVT